MEIKNSKIQEAYNEGYARGVKNTEFKYKDIHDLLKKEYLKGLNDGRNGTIDYVRWEYEYGGDYYAS